MWIGTRWNSRESWDCPIPPPGTSPIPSQAAPTLGTPRDPRAAPANLGELLCPALNIQAVTIPLAWVFLLLCLENTEKSAQGEVFLYFKPSCPPGVISSLADTAPAKQKIFFSCYHLLLLPVSALCASAGDFSGFIPTSGNAARSEQLFCGQMLHLAECLGHLLLLSPDFQISRFSLDCRIGVGGKIFGVVFF